MNVICGIVDQCDTKIDCIIVCRSVTYGKFFFSSNTLAVRTPKIILKLLLKTFSFSSNSDFFSCNRIFNTLNTKKCKKQSLNFTKPC